MKNTIRIYTIPNCGYCTEMKKGLDKKNLKYKEINVDLSENEDEFEEVIKISKTNSVPIMIVNEYLLAPEVNFWSIEEGLKHINTIIKEK